MKTLWLMTQRRDILYIWKRKPILKQGPLAKAMTRLITD